MQLFSSTSMIRSSVPIGSLQKKWLGRECKQSRLYYKSSLTYAEESNELVKYLEEPYWQYSHDVVVMVNEISKYMRR